MPDAIEVLLVEDNPVDAELILHSLGESIAARIRHVHDGEEALDFVFGRGGATHRTVETFLRLIILDIKLPKVNGLEVLGQIKRDPRIRAIPVVLLTSSKMEQDIAQGYRLGANSYIQKPVEFEQFRRTVRRLGRYWLEENQPPPSIPSSAEEGR